MDFRAQAVEEQLCLGQFYKTKGEYFVTELNKNRSVSEELLILFGQIPDLVNFDEKMYDTDLSYILSSV